MARRRKPKKVDEAPRPALPAGEARTSLKELLAGVSLPGPKDGRPPPTKAPAPPTKAPAAASTKSPAPPTGAPFSKPSETLRGADRTAYFDAYAGVKPLQASERGRASARVAPPPEVPARSAVDDEARARLVALVAGGVRFEVEREGDELRGLRVGTPEAVLRALLRRDAAPEASLDLHGMRGEQAEMEVGRFVRAQQRQGARRICIVHGKGNHSPGGLGVLRDYAVHALTEGAAAPFVRAFATASLAWGGSGALLVELTR